MNLVSLCIRLLAVACNREMQPFCLLFSWLFVGGGGGGGEISYLGSKFN